MRRGVLFPVVTVVLMATLAACTSGPAPAKTAEGSESGAPLTKNDRLLLAAAKVALPPPGIAAGDLPDPQSRGAQLLAEYCAQCHSLPAPTQHSATDWPSVVRRMWLRMDFLPESLGIKVPTPADRFELLSYLNANALKVSGTVLPAGKGRDEFAVVCSQCHALPDPRVHSAEDWPTVYSRMERNMERMQVQPPSGSVGQDILLYLQTVAGKRAAPQG
jgi:mono/diheme cytochrome c family protein